MADLRSDSALKALNEQDYINKLYDSNNQTQKDLINKNYNDITGVLNNEQNRVQQQTRDNIDRTRVEAQTAQSQYSGPRLSFGASQQQALVRGNAQRANINSLQQQQNSADAEIERQRQLLANQYATAIKKAQADNDMQRAQQLYNAAKDEEAKLLSLRQNAATMLAKKGDKSIQKSLLKGELPTADFTGETWEQVLKNEASLNEIYDNQLESEQLALQMENEKALSDLAAKQQKQQAQTDQKLTQSYVDALQKMKNYSEVQTSYGQGSGTAAAARIAQDTQMQKKLTDLRTAQINADANIGMERLDQEVDYRDRLYNSMSDINKKRAEELFKAAEKEEETLYNLQLQIGQQLAKKKDYSVLGKLYGLTKDQIDRMQGTGKYAPKSYGGGESSSSGYRGTKDPTQENREAAEAAHNLGMAQKWINDERLR